MCVCVACRRFGAAGEDCGRGIFRVLIPTLRGGEASAENLGCQWIRWRLSQGSVASLTIFGASGKAFDYTDA